MTSKAALFALLTLWGVGSAPCLPAIAEDAPAEAASDATPGELEKPGFTNRVWSKADDGDLPGTVRIFLSDGTLVQDSCWETHRLSQWRLTGENSIAWNEDGADITAEIVSLGDADLVLALMLGGERVEEHYMSATVPYLCPDLPRN